VLEKDTYQSLFKEKLLLLAIAIATATLILAILSQRLFILVTGIGLPAASIVGIIFFLSWTPPKVIPKPAKVEITAEPKEVIADGKSKSFITIQLLDKKGNTIAAPADTEIKLTTTGGKLESAVVKIPKGEEKAETVLISSKETGKIDLAADASGLESIDIKLNFKEKPRFCMCCGSRTSLQDRRCPECGEPPPSAPDTFKCQNCGELLPLSVKALFCRECGASQPVRKNS